MQTQDDNKILKRENQTVDDFDFYAVMKDRLDEADRKHAAEMDEDIKAYCDYEFNGKPQKTGHFRKVGESVVDFGHRTSDLIKRCPLWKKNFINEAGEYYAPSIVRDNVRGDILRMGTAMAHGAGVALKATAKGTGFVVGAGAAAVKTGIVAGYKKLSEKFPSHKKVAEKNAITAGWEYMAVKEYMNSATEYTQNNDLSPKEKAALLDTIKLTEGVRNAYYNKMGYEYYGVPEGKNAPPFLKKFLDRQCAANVDITSPEIVAQYDRLFTAEVMKCVKAGDMEAIKKLMPQSSEKPISQTLNEMQQQAAKSNEQVAQEAGVREQRRPQAESRTINPKDPAIRETGRTFVDARTGETFQMTAEEAAVYDEMQAEMAMNPEDEDDIMASAAAAAEKAASVKKPAQVTKMPKKPSKKTNKGKPLTGASKKNALLGKTPDPIEMDTPTSGRDDGMSR